MATSTDMATSRAKALTAELGDLLGLLGHDLGSPLTGLKGRLQLAQRRAQRSAANGEAAPPLDVDDIDRMLALVDRIGLLAATLSDAAQIQRQDFSLDMAPARLQPIITQAIARQYAMTPDVTILFEAGDAQLAGYWDKARIGRVTLTLIGNAVRFGRRGRPIIVRAPRAGDLVRVEVEDEGLGVLESEREAIFQFGGRGSNARQNAGSGLSLYVAREVVLLHGGDIGVETGAKGGSRFWFTLPVPGDDTEDR
jgi:signal transduction histidine kinase